MHLWKSSFKDYFKVLQIDAEAEAEVVTAAYYCLMKKYHPDKVSGNGDYARLINEAYEVLSDPERRQEYFQSWQEQKSRGREENSQTSYVSRRGDLSERERVLKNREEELEKRELALKLKIKLSSEFSKYAENSEKNQRIFLLPELIKKFSEAGPKELKDLTDQVRQLGKEKIPFIRECFKNKLSLEQEAVLCELLLEIKDPEVYPLLETVFKFRQFYLRLFQYVLDENLTQYKNKISLLSKNLSFTVGNNQELIPFFLELYRRFFTREENMEFLVKVQVLIENGKITGDFKNKILLGFLMNLKDFSLSEYFKSVIKKLDKEEKENAPVQAVLAVCKA